MGDCVYMETNSEIALNQICNKKGHSRQSADALLRVLVTITYKFVIENYSIHWFEAITLFSVSRYFSTCRSFIVRNNSSYDVLTSVFAICLW